MKKFAFAVVTVLSLNFAFVSSHAHASTEMSVLDMHPGFWPQVNTFLKRCAVQPFAFREDGRRQLGNLRSICPAELQTSPNRARFVLDGKIFVAVMTDSTFADEGDLNDLVLRTESGMVLAELRSVPAFGDVILALAGGDDDFPLEFDPSVLQ